MDNSEKEILFRGQRKSDNKWVEGYYVHFHKTSYCCMDAEKNFDNDIHRILLEETTDWGLPNRYVGIDIRPETLGQYTGKKLNNKKLFDGDIVEWENSCGILSRCVVIWDENNYCWAFKNHIGNIWAFSEDDWDDGNIIGNIHDNPELLTLSVR